MAPDVSDLTSKDAWSGVQGFGKEVGIESIRKNLARAADTGYSMWHKHVRR